MMVFKFSLLSFLLLASVTLAVPSSRRAASHRENRRSKSLRIIEAPAAEANTQYSANWAGAILNQANGTFTSVTGTFTVPTPSGSSGSAASVWVGIDGESCGQGLLQTGVDFTIGNEGVSYNAWYEWYPDFAYDFDGIDINAGDVITANVTAYSATTGIAIIENHTTGQIVMHTVNSSHALCGVNAEWVVEDFEQNKKQVSLADFGNVTFVDAIASGPSGAYFPCNVSSSAELSIVDMMLNDEIVTSVVVEGCNVTAKYV